MFDPLKLSKRMEKKATKKVGDKIHRKYYKFRSARFYGGIASADCVACNLRCLYCWSSDSAREGDRGEFYSPGRVAKKLISIAQKFGYTQLRITGNEPTISREHLTSVLEEIPKKYIFILETNGILLGDDESYVKELLNFENLHVRVSLKGCTEEEFSKLTGAMQEAFELQLKSLAFCVKHGVPCHPAILVDLVEEKNLEILKQRLEDIDRKLARSLEFEDLICYPHVVSRLKKAGLWK